MKGYHLAGTISVHVRNSERKQEAIQRAQYPWPTVLEIKARKLINGVYPAKRGIPPSHNKPRGEIGEAILATAESTRYKSSLSTTDCSTLQLLPFPLHPVRDGRGWGWRAGEKRGGPHIQSASGSSRAKQTAASRRKRPNTRYNAHADDPNINPLFMC